MPPDALEQAAARLADLGLVRLRMPLFEGEHLKKYWKEGGFDLGELLHDDFLIAIKKLYSERHFTSALKLLVCFVDTLAYLGTGVSSGASFKKWLLDYVDLNTVGITPDELWEHRNALLHMTNIESRKVVRGSVKELVPFIGKVSETVSLDQGTYKVYSQQELHVQISHGVARFVESLNEHRDQFAPFLIRYERTLSDTHYMRVDSDGKQKATG